MMRDQAPTAPFSPVYDGKERPALQTYRTLRWLYGSARAGLIQRGLDPETNADLQRWRDLGREKS